MARVGLELSRVTRVLRTADLIDEIHGQEDVNVHGVTQDSREVVPGDWLLPFLHQRNDDPEIEGIEV